ncbi:unnamed protein product [Lampetra planeri]
MVHGRAPRPWLALSGEERGDEVLRLILLGGIAMDLDEGRQEGLESAHVLKQPGVRPGKVAQEREDVVYLRSTSRHNDRL